MKPRPGKHDPVFPVEIPCCGTARRLYLFTLTLTLSGAAGETVEVARHRRGFPPLRK
jgi:hypothetical protein